MTTILNKKKIFENLFRVLLFVISLNKFKLFFQYKNKKNALIIINGLKINVAGKYLAVLLIDASPYIYGFLISPNPTFVVFLALINIFSKKLNLLKT